MTATAAVLFSLATLVTGAVLAVDVSAAAAADKTCDDGDSLSFGVDISYPIHHRNVSSHFPWLSESDVPDANRDQPVQPLGDKQSWYDALLEGCRESCTDCPTMCDATERDRIAMNVRQPKSMVNYTDTGIKKLRAPEAVMKLLTTFWQKNRGLEYPEDWSTGNTYVNHWEMPSYMLSVENQDLEGGGSVLRKAIWDAAQDTVSEWTGNDLTTSSLYGIRIYKEGAILAPHVDRLPLVSSCIINVDQDVDEPWPIEVYTHDGRAVNITMEPGDMVLYESHSIVHGRPFPLKGRFYANVFIHFQPEYEDPNKLPSYVIPGSSEARRWERNNPTEEKDQTEAHVRAANGDLSWLRKLAGSKTRYLLFEADGNGWTPLHEASRKGNVDVLKFLISEGADVNERTDSDNTALGIALERHGEGHPAVKYLRKNDALE